MMLNTYRLAKIYIQTVGKWLNFLGFKSKSKTKTFYVDGHEKIDTVRRRSIWSPRECHQLMTQCHQLMTFSLKKN